MWGDEIQSRTNNEFKILLTARKVLMKNVSHKIKNKLNRPNKISKTEINEKK